MANAMRIQFVRQAISTQLWSTLSTAGVLALVGTVCFLLTKPAAKVADPGFVTLSIVVGSALAYLGLVATGCWLKARGVDEDSDGLAFVEMLASVSFGLSTAGGVIACLDMWTYIALQSDELQAASFVGFAVGATVVLYLVRNLLQAMRSLPGLSRGTVGACIGAQAMSLVGAGLSLAGAHPGYAVMAFVGHGLALQSISSALRLLAVSRET